MLIDLQLHSTYSDGYLTPTELVQFIASVGVKTAALTDHNTVGGLDEFRQACARAGIKPITGLELYVKFHQYRFNVLWYNFDDSDPRLHNLLRESQVRRRRQMRIALTKLQEKRKFIFDVNKLLDRYNHYVPINHIVGDIVSVPSNWKKIKKELGLPSPREEDVIREYFYNKDIHILKNSFIDIDRIFKLRKEIGGQLILCHPRRYFSNNLQLIKDRLTTTNENFRKFISQEEDAVLEEELVNLKSQQVAYQATLQSTSEVMNLSILKFM